MDSLLSTGAIARPADGGTSARDDTPGSSRAGYRGWRAERGGEPVQSDDNSGAAARELDPDESPDERDKRAYKGWQKERSAQEVDYFGKQEHHCRHSQHPE